MEYRTAGGIEYGSADRSGDFGREAPAAQGMGLDGLALARVLGRLEGIVEGIERDRDFAWEMYGSRGNTLALQKARIDAAEAVVDALVLALVENLAVAREEGLVLWDTFNGEPANIESARSEGRLAEYLEQVRLRPVPIPSDDDVSPLED